MAEKQKRLETLDKNLLIGILIERNGGIYMEVKNRNKTDYIAVEALTAGIEEFVASVAVAGSKEKNN